MRQLSLFLIFIMSFCLSNGHAHDLVEIKSYKPKIVVDFRYATPLNSFGKALYPRSTIYVDRFVAHRLGRVMDDLAKECLGLIIYEGYRPPSVQAAMESSGISKEEAAHYRKGLGVDVAIYYLDGQPIELPSAYDTTGPRTYRDYYRLPSHVYHNSAVLEQIMTRYGFEPMREKWWHFDLRGYESAPDINLEYSDLLEHPAPKWE